MRMHVCVPLRICEAITFASMYACCVPHCFFAISAIVGDNCVSPCSATGAAMVKRIQQDMGSQKSDGKGHKSAGTGKWVSGTRKIILPLQQMQGRLLKGKGKVMSVLEPSKKKQTSNGKTVEGKKNVTFKGASKRMKMKSKKMRFPGKAKGKGGKVNSPTSPRPRSPSPRSIGPRSTGPRSPSPRSTGPRSPSPRTSSMHGLIKPASNASKKGAQPRQGRQRQ